MTHNTIPSDWINTLGLATLSDLEKQKIYAYLETNGNVQKLSRAMRFFLSVGAFLSILFLGFYMESTHLLTKYGTMGTAFFFILFLTLSLAFERLTRDRQNEPLFVFISQVSWPLMFLSKLSFCLLTLELFPHLSWIWTISASLITVAVYPFYSKPIDRFISVFICLTLVCKNIVDDIHVIDKNFWIYLLLILEVIVVMAVSISQKSHYTLTPLLYAFIGALLIQTLMLIDMPIYFVIKETALNLLIVKSIYGVSIFAVVLNLLRENNSFNLEILGLTLIGILLLSFFSPAGLLLALLCLILGYANHENSMSWIGLVFIPIFIVLYYYHLELSLLEKSIRLFLTGVTLIGSQIYIAWRMKSFKGAIP